MSIPNRSGESQSQLQHGISQQFSLLPQDGNDKTRKPCTGGFLWHTAAKMTSLQVPLSTLQGMFPGVGPMQVVQKATWPFREPWKQTKMAPLHSQVLLTCIFICLVCIFSCASFAYVNICWSVCKLAMPHS